MTPLYRTKLFRRQFFSLVGIGFVFFGAVDAALLLRTREAIIDRQLAITEVYRRQVAMHLRSWLEERRSNVAFLASMLELLPPEELPSPAVTRRLATFRSEIPAFVDALVVDSRSRLVNGTTEGARNVDLSGRSYVREALLGRSFVSKLFKGRNSGSVALAISRPIRYDALPRFALAGIVALDDIVKMLEQIDLGSLGEVFLLDEERHLVSSPDFASRFTSGALAAWDFRVDSLAARSIAQGKSGSGRYLSAKGVRVLGSWEVLPDIGLGLVVELSESEALAPVYQLLAFALVLALLLLIPFGALSFTLTSRLLKPIAALVDAADGLITDRPKAPIAMRTGTELDQLIELFNRMSDTVRRREDDLRDNAARDSLTGLFNHGRIEEYLGLELKRRRRDGEPVSFVMLDIDHFKAVNDQYGHQAGDEVLRALARVLLENVREGDIVGRYGGEEFAIVLASKNPAEVEAFCERIRKRVEGLELETASARIRITVSLGWCCVVPERNAPFDVIRKADRALYDAKNRGRNRSVGVAELGLAPAPAPVHAAGADQEGCGGAEGATETGGGSSGGSSTTPPPSDTIVP